MFELFEWLQAERNTEALKAALCAALAGAAVLYGFYLRRGSAGAIRTLTWALVFLGVLSAGAYLRFGNFRNESYINYHDVFHYYLGTKYHAELGYSNLYRCAVLADFEGDRRFRNADNMRDLETMKHVELAGVFARAPKVLAPFSAERWLEFKRDFEWLMERAPWPRKLIVDMGHNATPFWNAWATEIVNRIPTGSDTRMTLLGSVDFLLLAAMFAVVGRTLGLAPMLMCAVLFGVNYSLHAWTIKGSIFRMDWLAALVIGICLMKAGRYKTAGVFLAFSTLVRVFPLFFLFGLAVKTLVEWIRDRRPPPRLIAFWGAFSAAVALFVAGSIWHAGGTHQWRDFLGKISAHSEHIAPKRLGFSYAGLSQEQRSIKAIEARERQREGWFKWAVAAAVIGLAAWLGSRVEDDLSMLVGLPLMFFLINVTWYYYAVLLVPAVIFAARLDRTPYVIGFGLLCAYTFVAYLLDHFYPVDLERNTRLATVLLVYVLLTLAVLWWCGRNPRPAVQASA